MKQPNLQVALWTGYGSSLVYVNENDIYFRPLADVAHEIRLTNDGKGGVIFNGIPDWVYEGNDSILNQHNW